MKRKTKTLPAIFFKYLFSYTILFLIPIIIIGTIVLTDFITALRKQVIENNGSILHKTAYMVDTKVEEMVKIATAITQNQKLDPYFIEEGGYNEIEAIQQLRNYRATNDFIHEVFVYLKNDQVAYGGNGKYDFSVDSHNEYFDPYSLKQFFTTETKTISNATIKAYDDYLAYIYPITQEGTNWYMLVAFLVDKDVMTEHIRLNPFTESFVFDINHEFIVSTDLDEQKINIMQDLSQRMVENGYENIKVNGKDYIASGYISAKSGWRYMTLISTDIVLNQVKQMRTKFLMVVVITFIIGLIFIILLMKVNYRPINRLRLNLEDKLNRKLTAVDSLNLAINDVFLHNNKLTDMIADYKAIMRKQVIINVLKGQVQDNDEFISMCRELGRKIIYGKYRVALVTYDLRDAHKDKEQWEYIENNIIERIEEHIKISHNIHAYGITMPETNMLVFLLNYEQSSEDNIKNALMESVEQIDNEMQITVQFSIGSETTEVGMINKSYYEAVIAMKNASEHVEEPIAFFEQDADKESAPLVLIEADLFHLLACIKKSEVHEAKKMLTHILSQMNSSQSSVIFMKLALYRIVNSLLKLCSDYHIEVVESDYLEIVSYSESLSIIEIEEKISEMIEDICQRIKKEEKHVDIHGDIIDYIKDRFTDSNLSIQEIADHFNYSYKYISRIFKQQTGYNMSEYIARVRIEQFKKYLRECEEPIYKMVNKVGYDNEASLRRKFKQLEGITPKQYQELVRHEEKIN